MNFFLLLSLFTPLAGAILAALLGRRSEASCARWVRLTVLVYDFSILGLLAAWAKTGFQVHEVFIGNLYKNGHHTFDAWLFFDHITAVFLMVTAYISTIVVHYSKTYMHREHGYLWFFITILFFVFGMNLLIISGSSDLLFAGWEIVGITSFILIGFYHRRAKSVNNAFLVYVIYRICDVGILLSAWMSHVIWDDTLRFSELNQLVNSGHLLSLSPSLLFVFGLLLLLGTIGKSAQFPFSFWLPRAMEGPTPSSAIFYGALSIHAGFFLLLRMFPLWSAIPGISWLIGIEGFISAVLATLFARVQSNIKGQIAYASIAQVGIMLMELAAGLPNLALLHFVGNSGLRCFQLLVSPSAVANFQRMQHDPRKVLKFSDWSFEKLVPRKWRTSLYVFAIYEGFIQIMMERLIVKPIQKTGEYLHLGLDIFPGQSALFIVGLFLISLKWLLPELEASIVMVSALITLMISLAALTEKKSALRAWNQVGLSCFFMVMCVVMANGSVDMDCKLYMAGVIPGWIGGLVILKFLGHRAQLNISLEQFRGEVHGSPIISILMLVCFLMIAAFPIGPAFIGEDMLLQHATHQYEWLAGAIAIGFIFNGISLARIYTKVCLGPSLFRIPENSVGSGDFLVGSLPWSAGNRPENVLVSDSSGNGT